MYDVEKSSWCIRDASIKHIDHLIEVIITELHVHVFRPALDSVFLLGSSTKATADFVDFILDVGKMSIPGRPTNILPVCH